MTIVGSAQQALGFRCDSDDVYGTIKVVRPARAMRAAPCRAPALNTPAGVCPAARSCAMLTLSTGSSRDCDGVNLRSFLQVGALAGLGLSLPLALAAKKAS